MIKKYFISLELDMSDYNFPNGLALFEQSSELIGTKFDENDLCDRVSIGINEQLLEITVYAEFDLQQVVDIITEAVEEKKIWEILTLLAFAEVLDDKEE